jgi:hypothetical protein
MDASRTRTIPAQVILSLHGAVVDHRLHHGPTADLIDIYLDFHAMVGSRGIGYAGTGPGAFRAWLCHYAKNLPRGVNSGPI